MSKKYCVDQEHVGSDRLPLEEFYRNLRYFDGRYGICKTCHIRRATKRENRVRAERRAQGLTLVPTADERMERVIDRDIQADSYLERHEKRREQEATCLEEVSKPEIENEFTEGSGLSRILFNSNFLRQGKRKPHYSRC